MRGTLSHCQLGTCTGCIVEQRPQTNPQPLCAHAALREANHRAASVPYFALKFVAKYPAVKLYQESELGWLADERELPYWTYDAPFLMRGTNWLQFWGGQRIRMFGSANVSIVDVPGHEKFVKNMLAGVGGIDFVLLVVAADESIMPQTREHFDICRLLGVSAGIIVINKADLVDAEMLELVRDEVAETTLGSFLENAEIITVSAKTGEGIDRLKQAIHDLALAIQPRPSIRMLRLPIDRSFSIRGFGTVVTGTLTSGEIQKEQEVELIPGGLTTKVRGLQVHGNMTGRAVAGQRTAVNLQGVDLAQVERGMVMTVPHLFHSTQILDVRLHLLPTAKPLKNLVKVRFHQGTLEVLARVAAARRQGGCLPDTL